ncbi:hypothetical protein EWB00_004877 [Schistosoma japonicum]|uniref:Uncharacterized protein n=1 Tax=Schistosoma japonicum TaxID=6182 RepID=A0A4Z2DUP4_SCHJA|nr:hypothetical protein EWB00_004877 [Schistosoma japonicum]
MSALSVLQVRATDNSQTIQNLDSDSVDSITLQHNALGGTEQLVVANMIPPRAGNVDRVSTIYLNPQVRHPSRRPRSETKSSQCANRPTTCNADEDCSKCLGSLITNWTHVTLYQSSLGVMTSTSVAQITFKVPTAISGLGLIPPSSPEHKPTTL